MRLATTAKLHYIGTLSAAALLLLAACDSEDSSDLPQVGGHWESETFMHEDSRGTEVGQATLEVHFEQDGAELGGTGFLHLPQARVDMPFEIDGDVSERAVQFTLLYDTAPPEAVNCSVESDTLLKCFKGGARFNLNLVP